MQDAFQVDNTYAPVIGNGNFQASDPISGGTYSDLIWAKAISASGVETNLPLARNTDFHKPTAYYAPLTARVGFRLSF